MRYAKWFLLIYCVFCMILWLSMFFFVTGCTPAPTLLAYDCPIIKLPPDPIWQTKNINAKTPYGTVVKAYPVDLISCKKVIKVIRKQVQKVNATNDPKKSN